MIQDKIYKESLLCLIMVIGIRNKKGDVTISTVIWIVLGVAVLVMMVIGFTKGWGFFFDWFDKGPSELQTLAKACGAFVQGSLTIDFCKYNLIGNELVNCKNPTIIAALKADGIDVPESVGFQCVDANNANAKKACTDLVSSSKRDSVTVEGKLCSSLLGVCEPKVVPTGPSVAGCDGFSDKSSCEANTGCQWKVSA